MVRAGVVKNPAELPCGGYNEIQKPKRKNVLINYERLRELLGFDTYDSVKTGHKKWIESRLENNKDFREEKWTRSIAVGSERFIGNVKSLMGAMASGRRNIEAGESFQLRETQSPYIDHSGGKKNEIDPVNTFFWNLNL